jgi:hypothetical protein
MEVPFSSAPRLSLSTNIQSKGPLSNGLVSQVRQDFEGKEGTYLIFVVIYS